MTDRKTWKTGLSIGCASEAALKKAAEAGLDLVEICDIDDPANWENIPQWEAQTGVKVWSFHLPFRWTEPVADPATFQQEHWQQTLDLDVPLIENCGKAGIKYIVIHPSLEPYTEEEREARMQAAIEHLSILSDLCKKNGCVLCVEDLPRACLGRSGDEMLRFMESNADLRVCFDVNHLLMDSHEEFIRKVGKYIVTTHISDYDFVDERHWFPMDGQINWKEVQSALESADYTGPFLYETMPEGYTWADVRTNHERLKNL